MTTLNRLGLTGINVGGFMGNTPGNEYNAKMQQFINQNNANMGSDNVRKMQEYGGQPNKSE